MLVRRGRVQVSVPLDQWIDMALSGSGVTCLPVERQIAICAANLPEHHRDPADRLIIATTINDQRSTSHDSQFPLTTN